MSALCSGITGWWRNGGTQAWSNESCKISLVSFACLLLNSVSLQFPHCSSRRTKGKLRRDPGSNTASRQVCLFMSVKAFKATFKCEICHQLNRRRRTVILIHRLLLLLKQKYTGRRRKLPRTLYLGLYKTWRDTVLFPAPLASYAHWRFELNSVNRSSSLHCIHLP